MFPVLCQNSDSHDIPKRRPTALGDVANTDTKLLICSLFQKSRVLAQDGILARGAAGSFGAHRLRRRSRSDRLGNPIEGEAGVGYRLRPEYNLPTFMLTRKRSRRSCSGQRFGLPRARRETGCHAPGRRPRSRPGERWTSSKAGATPGPERASPPRRGIPGLDSGSLRWPLFAARMALSAARSPLWRKRGTRKSRLETKTENEASSALLAHLWCHLPLQNPANRAENLIRLCSATIGQTGWRRGRDSNPRHRLITRVTA